MNIKIKRLFYDVIRPFRKAYWYTVHPKTYGVKILIEHNGKFLFIRNSYGKKYWTIPGGGKNKKETPQEAAHREVLEEVGITLTESKYLGEYLSTRQHKRDTVYCFHATITDPIYRIDEDEVEEAQWFYPKEVPEPHSFAISEVLRLYKK